MSPLNLKKKLVNCFKELNQPILWEQNLEEVSPLQNVERDETFDVLKGIAIILVIVGHSEIGPLNPFISSFHMPLFFFVAGYFLKIRLISKEIQLSFSRLIIPYIFATTCVCFIAICKDAVDFTWADGSSSSNVILAHLFGYQGLHFPNWLTEHIGVLWFIWALFWARLFSIFFIRNIRSIFTLCIVFITTGFVGMFLNKLFFLPFCIPQGMCAASFLFVGYLMKKTNFIVSAQLQHLVLFLEVIWFYSWMRGGVGMNNCNFNAGYVFGLVGAVGAFVAIYTIVKYLYQKNAILWRAALICGRYSLVIYCVHAVETSTCNWRAFAVLHHIPLEYFALFQISTRFAVAAIFTIVLLKIKPIREQIFQIKSSFRE